MGSSVQDEFRQALDALATTDNAAVTWIVIHTARALKRAEGGQPIHWDVGWVKHHADGWKQEVKEQIESAAAVSPAGEGRE